VRVLSRPSLRVAISVGLVAGTVLALQVLLTRLLAAELFYHFGFLAISLALLGTGAGAILIYTRPQWFVGDVRRVLARWCAVLSGLLLLMPVLLLRLRFGTGSAVTAHFVLMLAIACVLAALPFTAAGIVVALAIRASTSWIGRLYAFDLAGAALGAIVVVPLMWLVAVPTLLVGLGAVAALASIALAAGAREQRFGGAVLLLSLALLALAAFTHLYYLPPVTTAPGLPVVADRWGPLNRVVGYGPPHGSAFGLVFYDRVYAPVPVHSRGAPLPDWRALHLGPQSIGYAMTGPGHALVIGGGGGRDIENALSSGQRTVDVIELNKDIVGVVDDDLGRWSGSPYTLPHVHTAIGDGRATLASRSTKYDQIHIGFTDTLSASSAQAFGLTEANLYTVEAYEEYFDHLRPDGILNVSRPYHLVGDEALRATTLAITALQDRGVAHPERNVVVVLGRDIFGELFGTVLARVKPWTASELARIRVLARQRGGGVAFAPGGPYQLEWTRLAAAPSVQAFCDSYRLDVCAPDDNRPFFFNMTRLGRLGTGPGPGYVYSVDPLLVLFVTLGILLLLALIAFVAPLWLVRASGRPAPGSLLFFAEIGLGFLLLEVVLVQRFVLFLGFPTYALSVVLFSLLLFTGAGALLSSLLLQDPRRVLLVALAIGTGLIIAAAFGLQPLLRELIGAPFAVRVAISAGLLAPFGLTLGMAMPIGLRRLAALYPAGVSWAWGINGASSVVASALGVAIAIVAGFEWATLASAACYLAAFIHAGFGRWPRADSATQDDQRPDVAPVGATA
jgi:spermine/spermidine synthase